MRSGKQWEDLDSKIVLKIDSLLGKSTLERKLATFSDIVYQTCLDTFGAKQHQTTEKQEEIIAVVNKARAKSAPGPNGVPYLLYKDAPTFSRSYTKYYEVHGKNIKISKEWMTAEGVCIPKEQDSRGINQIRPISLLNVEGKIFFSVMASRLTKYLTENGYINTYVQKGGIPRVSGCLEHATMIWEAIQRAKSERLNLDVVWLDLANAYGSVPREMIQLALRMYHVPEVIQVMLDDYFNVAMYCRKPKLKLPMKSILEEYKCGKARLLTMLEESDDPVVKTVQPCLKTGRKWKVTEAVDEAKECLKMKEVIGQTQIDRRGLGSTTAKWWSKTEGKEKRDMIIDEIRNKKDSTRVQKAVQQPQQGQWTNWDTAIQRSLTWNDIWHMAPLRISFLIRSVYDLLPSNANLVRWGKKDDPTCPLCQGRQSTEHVLSSCKVTLSQGRYTWRHNRVLQELASVISTAKGEIHPSSTSSAVFTTEGGVKKMARRVDPNKHP
ncbi:reverse transcriptase [Plakobranchus ocellatus]|uniref:Reverse transcriptase n=1 Tax=Plakobranchus ocellatus TaxID=259542 RepID=A0AAV4DTG5_9GAST|nr:reverse transcriptase [Plakobranchus ocellatus]